MLHPLIHLIVTQPQLLGSHAHAYGELISTELATHAKALKRRAVLGGMALCFIGVAAVLAGVSALLWTALVPAQQSVPWTMILVPLVPTVLALVCGLLLYWPKADDDVAFSELRRQLHADMALLRDVGVV